MRRGVEQAAALFAGVVLLAQSSALAAPETQRTGALPDIRLTALDGPPGSELAEGRALMGRRQWDEAVLVLKRAWDRNPAPEVAMELSKALVYLHRREEALQILGRASQRATPQVQRELSIRAGVIARLFLTNTNFQHYQDGLELLRSRRLRAARERFEKAAEQEKDNVEVLMRIAQTQVLDGDHDSAAERLRTVRRLHPAEPEASLWLGRALHQRGELAQAVEELRLAQQAMPKSELAQTWFAEALADSGAKAQAAAVLERGVKERPLNLLSLYTLAKLRFSALAPRDRDGLWTIRRDIQVARSRLPEYSKAAPASDTDLGLDLREAQDLRSSLDELDARVEARFVALRGPVVAPAPSEEE